ncbi:MAG: hypothetical protein ACI9ZF_000915 [Bradyrhizobium sp.]|jgi:hypothetical protein
MSFHRLRCVMLLVVLLGLGGCVSLLGPRDVVIPLERLQSAAGRKFPLSQRPMDLIDIRLSNPRLALHPGDNRISVTLDARVAPAFTRRVWEGDFVLSGMLQLDAQHRAVVVVQPRIDRIALDGIDPVLARQVAQAAGALAGNILQDMPLYSFAAEELRYGGSTFVPISITTQAAALVVTFAPAK